MRTLHSFAIVCVFAATLAALATACSSDDPTPPGGSAGSPGTAGSSSTAGFSSTAGASSTGDATKGAAVWTKQGCDACHGKSAAGDLGPNITFSKTAGIGNWTLAQFSTAVRSGKDIVGKELCLSMTRFSATAIDDAAMADLYAYLKSLPVSEAAAANLICH